MNQVDETLDRLQITKDVLFAGIIKRNFMLRVIISIFLIALSVSVYFSYQNSEMLLVVCGVFLLFNWLSIIPVLRLKHKSENRQIKYLKRELNNPRRMYSILKYGSNVNNLEDLDNVNLKDATKFDYEILDNFILEYKLIRQLTFIGICVVIGGLLLMSAVEIFYNVFLRWLFGALVSALAVLMIYFFLKLCDNMPYKIIFRNFEKYSDRCYDVGALRPLHYKMLKLYYNNYCSEGQFEVDDYLELVQDGVLDKKDIIYDYIKDVNYIRFTSLLSLGIGVACILQYMRLPINYSVSCILVTLILITLGRVRFSKRSLKKYEKILLKNNCILTSKIMKFLPEEYKEMF